MKKRIIFSLMVGLYLSLTISCASQSTFSNKEFDSCKDNLPVAFTVIDTVEVNNEI